MEWNIENMLNLARPGGIILGAAAIGYLLHLVLFALIRRSGQRSDWHLLTSIYNHLRRPARLFMPLLLAVLSVSLTGLPEGTQTTLTRGLEILLYLSAAWVIIECTDVVGDMVRKRFNTAQDDNLEERKIITQFQFVKRLVGVVVTIVALSFILMQFETVREIGAGLLTSAGIAGIVIGIAAQRPISNLLAGYQIAFTQPIRIDDVVIVEGEWGRIEEITMTYVVVRIWDQRRLVLPLTYFIEKPFQNWTRKSAELLGTIFLYTDYRVPVDALRGELQRIVDQSDLWDKRLAKVQVTNTTPEGLEIRALVSAQDASAAWDLRCLVREKLVDFMQREYPDSLSRTRVEMAGVPASNGQGSFHDPTGDREESAKPAGPPPDGRS